MIHHQTQIQQKVTKTQLHERAVREREGNEIASSQWEKSPKKTI